MRYNSHFSILNNKAWRKRLWAVCPTFGNHPQLKWFCSRNAAIMWLKLYAEEEKFYRMNGVIVVSYANTVYFHGRGPAESKSTCPYATRNN